MSLRKPQSCLCLLSLVLALEFGFVTSQLEASSGVRAVNVGRRLVASSPPPKVNIYKQAEAYMDDMLLDHESAKKKLGADGFKKSNVLVVYMCYERADVIRSTLTSLVMSEGLDEFDLVISQDGVGVDGTYYELDVDIQETLNALYIHHEVNLCTGLHHYFVKAFAFDIMGYEILLVVEEDNGIHHQALKMLKDAVEYSVPEREIGLVSVTDADNALLVDDSRYNNALLRAEVDVGHLWVFGVHKSRYDAVSQHLYDYYMVIKGRDYTHTHVWPLCDNIRQLHREKGFPKDMPLSQDAFFGFSLRKEGYHKRYMTIIRLFQPMGWIGLHFKQDPAHFYTTYGQGVYDGDITPKPYEIGKNASELEHLKKDATERLNIVYQQYLGRDVEEGVAASVVMRLLIGKMNAVELVRDIVNSAEHRHRMRAAVATRNKIGG